MVEISSNDPNKITAPGASSSSAELRAYQGMQLAQLEKKALAEKELDKTNSKLDKNEADQLAAQKEKVLLEQERDKLNNKLTSQTEKQALLEDEIAKLEQENATRALLEEKLLKEKESIDDQRSKLDARQELLDEKITNEKLETAIQLNSFKSEEKAIKALEIKQQEKFETKMASIDEELANLLKLKEEQELEELQKAEALKVEEASSELETEVSGDDEALLAPGLGDSELDTETSSDSEKVEKPKVDYEAKIAALLEEKQDLTAQRKQDKFENEKKLQKIQEKREKFIEEQEQKRIENEKEQAIINAEIEQVTKEQEKMSTVLNKLNSDFDQAQDQLSVLYEANSNLSSKIFKTKAALGINKAEDKENNAEIKQLKRKEQKLEDTKTHNEWRVRVENENEAVFKEVVSTKKMLAAIRRDSYGEEVSIDDQAKEDFVKLLEVAAQTKAPESLKPDGKISFLKNIIKEMDAKEQVRILKEISKAGRNEEADSELKKIIDSINKEVMAKMKETAEEEEVEDLQAMEDELKKITTDNGMTSGVDMLHEMEQKVQAEKELQEDDKLANDPLQKDKKPGQKNVLNKA